MTRNATTAAITATSTDPATTHAPAPTMPAPTVEPIALPKMRRSTLPSTGTTTNTMMRSISNGKPPPERACGFAAGFAAIGSPLVTTAMIWSTPASMPCANWFWRRNGAIVSAMIRRDVTSVSTPSRP